MSSSIHFQPLSGAQDEQPLAYLLYIDQVTILLDCGWSDTLDAGAILDVYRKNLKHVDLILLSHGDMEHAGALPFILTKLPNIHCPIFATLAALNMGRLALHDCLRSKRQCEDFTVFTKEDIDTAFDRIQPLKYSENVALSGKCLGISIVPLSAGHTIGGAIWRIKKDTDEIVYAVSYNHRTERHLNKTVLESFTRPSLLITDAYNATCVQPTRKQRDADLMDTILKVLRSDGTVLMPVDASTRVLELTFLLDQLWVYHQLTYPVILMTHRAQRTIEYAKGMLEWMGDGAMKHFSTTRESPYEFKYIKLCQQWEDLQKFGNGPKVVLTSCPSMETGFARDLFHNWAADERNLVLLTGRGLPGSTTRKLYDSLATGTTFADIKKTISRRVPLEGDELARHMQQEQAQREREEFIARKKRILEGDEESDAEEDLDQQLLFLGNNFDFYVKKDGNGVDGTMDFFADGRTAMFPSWEVRVKADDYGEALGPDEYRKDAFDQLQRQEPTLMDIDETEPKKDEDDADESVPSKYIQVEVDIPIRCATKYIDFEGLSDGKSIGLILQRVAPKKLILVHGTAKNMEVLKTLMEEAPSPPEDIFTPSVGEYLRVSAATNIYQVKLTDALVTSLKMAKINEYELAYIHGVIRYPQRALEGMRTPPPDAEGEKKDSDNPEKMGQDEEETTGEPADRLSETVIPSLDLLPLSERWKNHPAIVVGDPKLTELKRQLQNEGITSDFDKGALVIGEDRELRVQKDDDGVLTMEGPFCKTYYKVRSLVYRMHAFV